MVSASYLEGNTIRIKMVFQDDLGEPVNPDEITLRVKVVPTNIDIPPTTTNYTYGLDEYDEITRQSSGYYYLDLYLDEPGNWTYIVQASTIGVQSSKQRRIKVTPQAF